MRKHFSKLSRGPTDELQWLKTVNSTNIEQALNTGNTLSHQTIQILKASTDDYLVRCLKGLKRPPSEQEVDHKLTELIIWATGVQEGPRAGAIIACLHRLSTSASIHFLKSLITTGSAKDLVCVNTAHAFNSNVVSGLEAQTALQLIQLQSPGDVDFHHFAFVIQQAISQTFTLLTPDTISAALGHAKFKERSQHKLRHLLHQGHIKTAFDQVSWVATMTLSAEDTATLAILDRFLDSWRSFRTWKPNRDRMSLWEDQSHLTAYHRRKLAHVFALEGPDTTGSKLGTLALAEPQCYQCIPLPRRDQPTLRRFLGLVDHAISAGLETIDFFISICIDTEPTEEVLLLLENSLSRGILSCRPLILLQQWLTAEADLYTRVDTLRTAIGQFSASNPLDPFFMQEIVEAVEKVLGEAQQMFRAQLQDGDESDAFGFMIHELATSIGECEAVLLHFPSDGRLRRLLSSLPSRETIEVVFKQLDAFREPFSRQRSHGGSRLKSYLSQALGDGGVPEPSMAMSLARELQFWRSRPGTDRSDVARQIAEIKAVSYDLYVSCLHQMLNEEDLVMQDMKPCLKVHRGSGIPSFARYLARRRRMRLVVHECWVSLLVCLISEEGPSFMVAASDALSGADWLQFLEDLRFLIGFNNAELARAGFGLTREALSWLDILQDRYKKAVEFLTHLSGFDGKLKWVFQAPREEVKTLLEECREPERLGELPRQILALLQQDGQNVQPISTCIVALKRASPLGYALCHNFVARVQDGSGWSHMWLEAMAAALYQHAELPRGDKVAVEALGNILGLRPRVAPRSFLSLSPHLMDHFGNLIGAGRSLEALRVRLRRINPERTSSLLQSVGVEDTRGGSGRADFEITSDALVDAVEAVGHNEYEIAFALTGLSEARRKARGVPPGSRSVIVRVVLTRPARFCIHLPDYDNDNSTTHTGWSANQGAPSTAVCTARPNLFTHLLGINLISILSRPDVTLASIFDAATAAVRDPPTACLTCGSSMPQRWAPTTCRRQCSVAMRRIPLEIRLGRFSVEPSVADLLLTCAYAAASDSRLPGLDLLPGCPVPADSLASVIDSFPAMAGLATATDIRSFVRGRTSDGMAQRREDVMSWLALFFRGFIVEAADSYLIPSMPGVRQFVLLNSPPELEAQFTAGVSGPVFHGTRPSRLLAILGGGLRNMTGGPGQANGAAYGPGVYCGDDPSTSLSFCGSTGQSWRNSALGNRSVLLGCELASYARPRSGNIHVIQQETRLLVRYIFLLPPRFTPPGRHHVDTALSSVFSRIRSSM